MKRKTIGLLMLMIAFMTLSMGVSAAKVKSISQPNHMTKKTWHKKFIKKGKINGRKVKDTFKYKAIIDINNDGVKELLLSTTKGPFITCDDTVSILTYYKKKVILAKEITNAAGGELYFNKKAHRLTHWSRGSGESFYKVYKLKKKRFTVKKSFSYQLHSGIMAGNREKPIYRMNGKKTTYKKYIKAVDKYSNEKEAITYK